MKRRRWDFSNKSNLTYGPIIGGAGHLGYRTPVQVEEEYYRNHDSQLNAA